MELNHHIIAKQTTDAILSHFKDGSWKCAGKLGADFYRTNVFPDFPIPDSVFADDKNKVLLSFEFKPATETKRGILTGLGQCIAYLDRCTYSFLIIPDKLDGVEISEYILKLFREHIKSNLPVGLISYNNDNPAEVRMLANVKKRTGKSNYVKPSSDGRFWAKHQDLPLQLFHLVLHYYFTCSGKGVDPFAECWQKSMIPADIAETLQPKPILDIEGNPILTMTGKPVLYLENIVSKVIQMDPSERQQYISDKVAVKKPSTWGKKPFDNYYTSVRKNILSFMKNIHAIDSHNTLTESGEQLYLIGKRHGVSGKLFRDYFAKELLLSGHHFDLLIDYDQFRRNNPDVSVPDICRKMESEYEKNGYIKRNSNRAAHKGSTKQFLTFERALWSSIGLTNESGHVNWKHVMEVCTLQ